MYIAYSFLIAFAISLVTIRLLMPVASQIGLVDKPGGHKTHADEVPLLGGIGIYLALAGFLAFLESTNNGTHHISIALLLSTGLLFAVGLYDDIRRLSVKTRVVFQIVAVMIMALYGEVYLTSLGSLFSNEPIQLGMLALPFTVIATVGVINAVNLIDGIDGLSGILSLISLSFLAMVSWMAGGGNYLLLILSIIGGVAGFLYFNLRRKGKNKADAYMGDAGSTVIGFLFAWLFIALSQGDSPAMAPVTALWFFAVPLMDTVTTMMRRISQGKSPFQPDRTHLHHQFMQADYTVTQTVIVMGMIQLFMGAIGVTLLITGISETLQLLGFLAAFAIYAFITVRHWKSVPAFRKIHRKLDWPIANVSKIFVGNLNPESAEMDIFEVLRNSKHIIGFELFPHIVEGKEKLFAVIHIDDAIHPQELINNGNLEFRNKKGIVVRQFIEREERRDQRQNTQDVQVCLRTLDRRSEYSSRESISVVSEKPDDKTARSVKAVSV